MGKGMDGRMKVESEMPESTASKYEKASMTRCLTRALRSPFQLGVWQPSGKVPKRYTRDKETRRDRKYRC